MALNDPLREGQTQPHATCLARPSLVGAIKPIEHAWDVVRVEEFKLFEKDFRNRQVGFDLAYNTREYQSISTGFEFGRNFDADYRLWTTSARYKVTPELSAEYSLAASSQRASIPPEGASTRTAAP